MLRLKLNLNQKIIMIKVTHTQKNGGGERGKSKEKRFAQA